MDSVIRIKPHHLIDILTDYGCGHDTWQPHPFGHAVHTVAHRIVADRNLTVEMDSGADDICAPCMHNIGGLCDDTIDTVYRPSAPTSKRQWNLLIDRRWYGRLGLNDGDRLTAIEFAQRVHKAIVGGIDEIYVEIPADRNADRLGNLVRGLERFLEAVS